MGNFARISDTDVRYEGLVSKLLRVAMDYRLKETGARSIGNDDEAAKAQHRAQTLEARVHKLDTLYREKQLYLRSR